MKILVRSTLKKGSVVHAECKFKKGLDAFYSLMEIEEGEFSIVDIPSNNIPEKSISKATNQLLLDAAFLIDTKRYKDRCLFFNSI